MIQNLTVCLGPLVPLRKTMLLTKNKILVKRRGKGWFSKVLLIFLFFKMVDEEENF